MVYRVRRTGWPVISLALFAASLVLSPVAGAAVNMQWVTVGDPGNAGDAANALVGSMPYVYQISKYLTTNTQYAEFLNAKDATGSNALGLYGSRMNTPAMPSLRYVPSAVQRKRRCRLRAKINEVLRKFACNAQAAWLSC